MMPEAKIAASYILGAVSLIQFLAPGYFDDPLERPKKGFWQAIDVVYPLRKAFRGLWPQQPELLTGYRSSLFWAWFISSLVNAAAWLIPVFAKANWPLWLAVESCVIVFLIGQAFGFWSADRRLKKRLLIEQEAKQAAR
jgi:hypothetical protein